MKFCIDFGGRKEAGVILDEELGRAEEAKVLSLKTGEEITVSKKEIHDEIISRTASLQQGFIFIIYSLFDFFISFRFFLPSYTLLFSLQKH